MRWGRVTLLCDRPYPKGVTTWVIVLAAAAVGALLGIVVTRARNTDTVHHSVTSAAGTELPEALMRVLPVLPQTSIVVDSSGAVLNSCLEAQALGIVTGDRLTNPEVMALAGEVARTGEPAERDIELVHPSFGRVAREMYMRAAPVTPQVTLILLEDLSESRRVDAVRRDFVANVSHELKTPVGALGILAEAVEAASDEPEEVRHFARRMRIESQRLAALVNDIIDLSRLQGDNPLEHANVVSIDRVIAEAIDATRLAAGAKAIDVVRGGTSGLTVFGEENHLITALRNLISNAINYSPESTRIAVGTRLIDGVVEMSVTDQGIGISSDEQSRIFERFYRVDQARSRGTGGTGLGLAIVKHVCVNHGGEVTVWSRTGEGSTFTIRIPAQASLASPPPPAGVPSASVVVDLASTSNEPTIIEAAS